MSLLNTVATCALAAVLTATAPQGPRTVETTAGTLNNVCVDPNYDYVDYCENVGRTAVNWANVPDRLKGVELRKIVAVVWRREGNLISSDGRRSPRNAFYYAIDDGIGKPFLRQCWEVKVK